MIDNKTNEQVKSNKTAERNVWFKRFLAFDLLILIISIIVPYFLINLNHIIFTCFNHTNHEGGMLWIWGRTLGFSTLTWFIFTMIKGAKTKRIAKLFQSYPKAKNYHSISALTTNVIFGLHVMTLLLSEPWGDLIFKGESNHIPYILFLTKIWTGVFFGTMMVSVTILFFYLKDMNRFKKFGYKRFIRVHYIMLISTGLLAVHIFLINTEILIIFWG